MSASPKPQPEPRPGAFWAAILSYLVPGLGQICQGRVAKGLLFLVCLYGLFFYGMALGDWKNVYVPHVVRAPDQDPLGARQKNPLSLPTGLANVWVRLQYAGQFWIGIAAWPAIWQYMHEEEDDRVRGGKAPSFWSDFQRAPPEHLLNEMQTNGDKTWDLAWVFTVIAGVLNVLVIYDALAGPAFTMEIQAATAKAPEALP